MARAIKQYWQSVRKLAASFDPEAAQRDAQEDDPSDRKHLEQSTKEVWLISVANETVGTVPGKVVSAHPMNAARLIKEGTHVLAEDHQVTEYKRQMALRKEQIEEEEADRKGVPTSKLLQALIAAQTGPRSSGKSTRE